MSQNDQIILEQIIADRAQTVGNDLKQSEFFEIFSAEQILKNYDLSYEEIRSGITGNGGDGGIDSAYVFVNGELVQEDEEFPNINKNINIDLVFIQSKTSKGFGESAVEKFISTTRDLLDLSSELESFSSVYNSQLLSIVRAFRNVYKKLAAKFPALNIQYYYVSMGAEVHPNVKKKTDALKIEISKLFSESTFSFEFVGAPELLSKVRTKPITSFELRLSETPISSTGDVGFICLVKIADYFDFITDDNNKLRRNIFDANVRDYQGDVQVNAGIQNTLKKKGEEDFWWLNNGVTIVASKATQSAKSITIENPNIVNGLQTSTEIYKYFRDSNTDDERRNIQVKVVVPTKPQSLDRIVKATNSQTNIPGTSLRATEKIHRDIEDFLKVHNIFYDRRKNYYKNMGKPISSIIGIGKLAQSVMAIVLGRPNDARARPSSLLKNETDYEQVFSETYPLEMYLFCANTLMKVETFLRENHPEIEAKDRNNIRFHVSMAIANLMFKSQTINPKILTLDALNSQEPNLINDAFSATWGVYLALGKTDQVGKGTEFPKQLKQLLIAGH